MGRMVLCLCYRRTWAVNWAAGASVQKRDTAGCVAASSSFGQGWLGMGTPKHVLCIHIM